MSYEVELADVKRALRVFHSADDAELTRLIGAAVREYLQFINSDDLETGEESSSSSTSTSEDLAFIPEDAFQGIVRIVQAEYEGDIEMREKYRKAAEVMWMPYRQHMGV